MQLHPLNANANLIPHNPTNSPTTHNHVQRYWHLPPNWVVRGVSLNGSMACLLGQRVCTMGKFGLMAGFATRGREYAIFWSTLSDGSSPIVFDSHSGCMITYMEFPHSQAVLFPATPAVLPYSSYLV